MLLFPPFLSKQNILLLDMRQSNYIWECRIHQVIMLPILHILVVHYWNYNRSLLAKVEIVF